MRALERTLASISTLRTVQERNNILEYSRTFGELLGEYLSLSGLIGFWPLSAIDRSSGDAVDIGQGKTLTYTGNPTYNLLSEVVPYIDLDGTGDWLSRADEVDFDIIGSEAQYAAALRGLTMGAWINLDSIVGDQDVMGKWNVTGNLRQYKLYANAGVITLGISSNGTAEALYAGGSVVAGTWSFVCGRWSPSVTGDIFVDGVKVSNVSAVATMTNLTAPFRVGDRGDAVSEMAGLLALPFLCANALPDSRIQRLYNLGRVFFGV